MRSFIHLYLVCTTLMHLSNSFAIPNTYIGNTNAVSAILVKGHHVRASSSTLYGDGPRMKYTNAFVWFLLSDAIYTNAFSNWVSLKKNM